MKLSLSALFVFNYLLGFSAFATECGRPDGHGEVVGCGVVTTTTMLRQDILSDVEEEFQNFQLRFVPATGQFNMLRQGGVGSSFPMSSDHSGWLSKIEALGVRMGGFDTIDMKGEYVAISAEGRIFLQRPEGLTFKGEPKALEDKVRDVNFWQKLTGPLPVKSITVKTTVVRTLNQIDTLGDGRTSRRKECQLTRTINITLNEPESISLDFFKEHSAGFLGPIRAVNELKETSLIELEDCPQPELKI